MDTNLTVFGENCLVGRSPEHTDRQCRVVAPSRRCRLTQPLDCVLSVEARSGNRQPAIAKFHDAIHGIVARAAEKYRRVGTLRWLRVKPDGIEVHHFAVESCLLLCPESFHRQDAFAHQLEPRFVARSVILHLIDIPATTYTEKEPAV